MEGRKKKRGGSTFYLAGEKNTRRILGMRRGPGRKEKAVGLRVISPLARKGKGEKG